MGPPGSRWLIPMNAALCSIAHSLTHCVFFFFHFTRKDASVRVQVTSSNTCLILYRSNLQCCITKAHWHLALMSAFAFSRKKAEARIRKRRSKKWALYHCPHQHNQCSNSFLFSRGRVWVHHLNLSSEPPPKPQSVVVATMKMAISGDFCPSTHLHT